MADLKPNYPPKIARRCLETRNMKRGSTNLLSSYSPSVTAVPIFVEYLYDPIENLLRPIDTHL
jgi:hypothetical protein